MIKWLFALLLVLGSAYALNCNGTYAGYSGSTDYTGIAYYNVNQSCSANNNQSVPYMNAWVFDEASRTPTDDIVGAFNLTRSGINYDNTNQMYSSVYAGGVQTLTGSSITSFSTGYTFTTWILPRTNPSRSRVFLSHNWGTFYFDGNSTVVVWYCGNGTAYVAGDSTASGFINRNSWMHVAIVNNGTLCTIYKNGVATDTQVSNGVGPMTGGFQINGNADPLNGSISDLKIYNSALTAAQIMDAYNNNTSVAPVSSYPMDNFSLTNGTVSTPPSTIRSCPVFVQGIDPLDDLSGYGTDLTYVGTGATTTYHNLTSQAFESYGPVTLRGLKTPVLNDTPSINLSNNSGFSYEIDFQLFKLPNQNCTGFIGMNFRNGMDVCTTGLFRYGARNATDTSQAGLSSGVNVGLARHTAVLVYNATDENMTVYFNGTWKSSTRITVDNFFSPTSTTDNMIKICDRAAILGSNNEDINGTCYGAAIYNKSLSALEVMNNYQGNRVTNGLVGYYPFTNQSESGSCS